MEQLNPFTAGPPVDDETKFWGRSDLVEKIMDDVYDPACRTIAIQGPRRIGKSSILKQLEFYLSDEDFIQIYFDLGKKGTLYLNELLYNLARAIANAVALPMPRQEDFDRDGVFFTNVFLPGVFKARIFNQLVLLFDEFEDRGNSKPGQAGREFYPYLFAQLEKFEHIKCICAIGRSSLDMMLHANFGSVRTLTRWSRAETEGFIRTAEMRTGLRWVPAAIKRIWQYAHGQPYLTQLLCKTTIDRMLAKNVQAGYRIAEKDIEAAVPEALWQADDHFQGIWRSLSEREQTLLARVLASGNAGLNRTVLEEYARNGNLTARPEVIEHMIKKFTISDVLQFSEGADARAFFSVPLFAYWISANYATKQQGTAPQQPEQKNREREVEKTAAKIEMETAPTPAAAAVQAGESGKLSKMAAAHLEEKAERWDAAIAIYESLLTGNKGDAELSKRLRHARTQQTLAGKYQRVQAAITAGRMEEAQQLLTEILLRDAEYKDAARYLLLVTTGDDIREIKSDLERERETLDKTRARLSSLQNEIEKTNAARQQSEMSLAKAQEQIAALTQAMEHAEKKAEAHRSKLYLAEEQLESLQTEVRHLRYKAKIDGKRSQAEKRQERDKRIGSETAVRREATQQPAEPTVPVSVTPGQEAQAPAAATDSGSTPHGESEPIGSVQDPARSGRQRHTPADGTAPDDSHSQPLPHPPQPDAPDAAPAPSQQAPVQTPAQHSGPPLASGAARTAGAEGPEAAWHESARAAVPDSEPFPNRLPAADENPAPQPNQGPQTQAPTAARTGENPAHRGADPVQRTGAGGRRPRRASYQPSRRRSIEFAQAKAHQQEKHKKELMSWFASTLIWLPLFAWIVWLWSVNPLDWGNGGKIFVLISVTITWLTTSKYGDSSKENEVTWFFVSAPVIAFCFATIMTFETMRPGMPDIQISQPHLIGALALIYLLATALLCAAAGETAVATMVGVVGGSVAGFSLFQMGGGAIESTFAIIFIVTLFLKARKVDFGMSISGGILVGIPVGFLIYATTAIPGASAFPRSLLAITVSYLLYPIASAFVYAMILIMKKIIRPSGSKPF